MAEWFWRAHFRYTKTFPQSTDIHYIPTQRCILNRNNWQTVCRTDFIELYKWCIFDYHAIFTKGFVDFQVIRSLSFFVSKNSCDYKLLLEYSNGNWLLFHEKNHRLRLANPASISYRNYQNKKLKKITFPLNRREINEL